MALRCGAGDVVQTVECLLSMQGAQGATSTQQKLGVAVHTRESSLGKMEAGGPRAFLGQSGVRKMMLSQGHP